MSIGLKSDSSGTSGSIVINGSDKVVVTSAGNVTAGTFTGALTGSLTAGGSVTSGVAVASTSGTAIDFTSIPSWVKRITVMFSGVSANGTSSQVIQIGSGSITSTGYIGQASSGAGQTAYTTAFIVNNNVVAANTAQGIVGLFLLGSNTWTASGVIAAQTAANSLCTSAGYLTLSGTLDRVRITTANGTDTFDAGSVNIMYEG